MEVAMFGAASSPIPLLLIISLLWSMESSEGPDFLFVFVLIF